MQSEDDRVRLLAALALLSRHLDEGGELPSGHARCCYDCPVAVYLTEKVEKPVGVACDIAWIEDNLFIGDPRVQVTMPTNVVEWVRNFDWENEETDELRSFYTTGLT